jgi:Mrp family chromosome partitioning ATPase
VLGSIPVIPARALQPRLTSARHRQRHQHWHDLLSQSVSRVAANLLGEHGPRSILVTSAAEGEGKTTISTQLALALASAGRSVVLVDLDLRRAAVHRVFGLQPAPGVCEALRREVALAATLQPTETERLSIVAAGHCDRVATCRLGYGSTTELFKEMRTWGRLRHLRWLPGTAAGGYRVHLPAC